MSFPFAGEVFTFTQPDGTKLQVRGWGDQHRAVFETLDGYPVVEDPATGFYQYASLTPEGDELRPTGVRPGQVAPAALNLRQGARVNPAAAAVRVEPQLPKPRWRERHDQTRLTQHLHLGGAAAGVPLPAPPTRHVVGDYLGLCLLIQFPDVSGAITKAEVEAYCNQSGYAGFGNNGSVYDYFFDNSGGKLKYKTVVTPYYTAQHPKAYYTDPNITYGTRARELVKEALAYHKSQGFDFSGLTVDDQNAVYATNIFYAGTVDNAWKKGLWPHASRLVSPYQLAPGKFAVDYQITSLGTTLKLGTYCHENGHMLCDFPDLYSYADQRQGIGTYCLMCLGGNANQFNPTQIGAYLKYRAGWGEVTQISNGLTASAGRNQFFIHSKSSTEYFLIENRHRQGRDAALADSGLAIWHIDELGSNSQPGSAAPGHQRFECSLMQADGRHDLDQPGGNTGDQSDLFRQGLNVRFAGSTNPNSKWFDGTSSGLDIHDIGPAAATVSFKASL